MEEGDETEFATSETHKTLSLVKQDDQLRSSHVARSSPQYIMENYAKTVVRMNSPATLITTGPATLLHTVKVSVMTSRQCLLVKICGRCM